MLGGPLWTALSETAPYIVSYLSRAVFIIYKNNRVFRKLGWLQLDKVALFIGT